MFQPMGQLVTLVKDKLQLPLLSVVGFLEVLAAMIVVVIVAYRIHGRRTKAALRRGQIGVGADPSYAAPRRAALRTGTIICVLIIEGNRLRIPGSPVMNHASPMTILLPIFRWGKS
jgi:hypothetical protein